MKTNFISHSKMILGNERGGMAALLSVIVLSLIMVSTLSSFYIYVENRAKFQERVRINYQMGYVMEDMSRAVVEARERLANGNCPVGNEIYVDCTLVCGTQTRAVGSVPGLPGTVTADVPNLAVCIRNDSLNRIVNGADYFCAYNTDPGNPTATPTPVPPSYCPLLAKNETLEAGATMYATAPPSKSKVKNWYARLDKFFDTTIVKNVPGVSNSMQHALTAQIKAPTVLGWLIPEKAVAQNYPPTGGHPTEECGGDAFCKSSQAETGLQRIGNPSTGCVGSSDSRCKRCTGTQRNSNNCLKFSVCPPWVDARECVGDNAGGDKRIHQVVMMENPPTWTPPSTPTSLCWGNVTPPTGSQNGPAGYMAANAARCAVPAIACSNFGQIMVTECMEVSTATGTDRGMVAGYTVRCVDSTTGAPGYAGCVEIPNLTPPVCAATSSRVCYGAENTARGDTSCCTGASICTGGGGIAATCVNGGGMGGGCQTYSCNQATGMCHWVDCP